METFYQILAVLGAVLIVWYLYRTIKGRPDVFSRDKLNNSLKTMGILGIILIVFVAFLIFMVRQV